TPTRSHWPFRSGYFDSSRMRALAEAISAAVSATAANRRKSCIGIPPHARPVTGVADVVLRLSVLAGQPAITIHHLRGDANGAAPSTGATKMARQPCSRAA